MRLALAAAAALLATTPALAELKPGATAPLFTAQGSVAGQPFTVDLKAALKKGPVVLYFFPAAFTPGCSAEAAAFAAAVDDFKKAGAVVIGMSADPVDKLRDFSAKDCAGKFAVASASPEVIRGYDVALGRQIQGRDATNRTSYVIAPDGKIIYAHSDLSPADHVRNTLAAVRDWRAKRKR